MSFSQIRTFAKEHDALDKPLFFDWECNDDWYSINTFIAKKDIGFHWTNGHLIDGIEAYIEGEHEGAVVATVRQLFEYIRRKDQQYLDFHINYCPYDGWYGCCQKVEQEHLVAESDGIHIKMSQFE